MICLSNLFLVLVIAPFSFGAPSFAPTFSMWFSHMVGFFTPRSDWHKEFLMPTLSTWIWKTVPSWAFHYISHYYSFSLGKVGDGFLSLNVKRVWIHTVHPKFNPRQSYSCCLQIFYSSLQISAVTWFFLPENWESSLISPFL